MSNSRPSGSSSSPTALGPSPLHDESYYEMLHRLCRIHLPHDHPTSDTAQPPALCLYPSCPVHSTHARGLYTYRGVPMTWQLDEFEFGVSNPPPNIWFARHRIVHETGSNEDYHLVHAFLHYHYVPRASPQQDDNGRENSPSITSSENPDTNMMEVTDEMAGVDLNASNNDGQENIPPTHQPPPPPPPQRHESPTQSELSAEMDRDLSNAYYDMELEDAENGAAQMNITDGIAEDSIATQAVDTSGDTQSQPASGALQELVEVAYLNCAADADLAPENGNDGIQ
ncbi:MAG: hypothetical protein Q9226_004821 [Calogaya cf. arnoldii]